MRIMSFFCRIALVATLAVPVVGIVPDDASAQSRRDYCSQRAQQFSGYRGQRPGGGFVGGAITGAIGGALGGTLLGVIGGKGIKTKKAARRGAGIGAVIGAIGGVRQANRVRQQRRIYMLEYESCMRGR